MNLKNHFAYRALCGGVWERTQSCGWYQLDKATLVDRACRIPPNVLDYEDHRADHVYLVGCVSCLAIAGVLALVLIVTGG